MLTSLTLTNFRGFARLEIPRLARINLIGGVNNAGKTAVLEAIYLLLSKGEKIDELPHLFRPSTGVDDGQYYWRWLARNGVPKAEFSMLAAITGHGLVNKRWEWALSGDQKLTQISEQRLGRMVRMITPDDENEEREDSPTPQWPLPEAFSPSPSAPVDDARVYIEAVRRKGINEERIEDLLREIDPRLKRIRSFPDEKTNLPILHVGIATGEAIPASQLGQGFNRLLRIYSAFLSAGADVFLIDEIETGLHHSVLPTIWQGLSAVARQEDVQVFATTHSREAILAAHRVFAVEPEYDFAYHRLERDAKGEVQVVTYDGEAMAGADEADFELR